MNYLCPYKDLYIVLKLQKHTKTSIKMEDSLTAKIEN